MNTGRLIKGSRPFDFLPSAFLTLAGVLWFSNFLQQLDEYHLDIFRDVSPLTYIHSPEYTSELSQP